MLRCQFDIFALLPCTLEHRTFPCHQTLKNPSSSAGSTRDQILDIRALKTSYLGTLDL